MIINIIKSNFPSPERYIKGNSPTEINKYLDKPRDFFVSIRGASNEAVGDIVEKVSISVSERLNITREELTVLDIRRKGTSAEAKCKMNASSWRKIMYPSVQEAYSKARAKIIEEKRKKRQKKQFRPSNTIYNALVYVDINKQGWRHIGLEQEHKERVEFDTAQGVQKSCFYMVERIDLAPSNYFFVPRGKITLLM